MYGNDKNGQNEGKISSAFTVGSSNKEAGARLE